MVTKGADLSIRVRIAPMYPLSIVYGGFEIQCVETCKALQQIGLKAKLLDWNDKQDEFDILHLFGPSPGWFDICIQARGRYHIVISAIAASTGRNLLYELVCRFTAWGGSLLHQQTTYERTLQVLQIADRIICLNNLERRFFLSTFRLQPDKVVIIPNGVAESRFHAVPGLFLEKFGMKNYVLFVGNIVARKNPLILAQVLKQKGWKGVFIGNVLSSEEEYARQFETLINDSPNFRLSTVLDY